MLSTMTSYQHSNPMSENSSPSLLSVICPWRSFQYMIEYQFYENWVHVMRNRKILSRHQKKIYNGMHTTKTTRRYNLVKEKLEHIKTKNKNIDTPWIRHELFSWTFLLTSLVNFFRDFLSNFYCCASNDIFPLTAVK